MPIEPVPPKRVSQRALRSAAVDYPLIRPLLVALNLDFERTRQHRENVMGLCTVATAKIRLGDLDGAIAIINKISAALK